MFLLGSMTLCVETERREERECVLCHQGLVEDQEHFACECPFYQEEREQLLARLGLDAPTREELPELIRAHEFQFVNYIQKIWEKRCTELERRSKILLNLDLVRKSKVSKRIKKRIVQAIYNIKCLIFPKGEGCFYVNTKHSNKHSN